MAVGLEHVQVTRICEYFIVNAEVLAASIYIKSIILALKSSYQLLKPVTRNHRFF